MPYPLILASTSKYRTALLSQLGWDFENISPEVNEDDFKNKAFPPSHLALLLSEAKAKAVFLKRPDACVIGSDQVCSLEGSILSKPVDKNKAIDQLYSLQGKVHELLTAVSIINPNGKESFLNKTKLHMRQLSLEQIEHYISEDLPLDCAGSYKLESRGIRLFEKIEMSDHTAIIGLPLIDVTTALLKLGYRL